MRTHTTSSGTKPTTAASTTSARRPAVLAAVALALPIGGPALGQSSCPPERLTSPSGAALRFGRSLVMNNRHMIIGDPSDSTLCPGCFNGWAWAYTRRPDGGWEVAQDLIPADLAPSWVYGVAAALDGDRAIVTALQSTAGPGLGVPYVFEFDGERWNEVDALPAPDTRSLHGERLALHGDTALVGKAKQKVLVYRNTGEGWVVTHDLSNPDRPLERHDFGWSFDLNDDWIAIGAPLERITATNGGAVYVYRRLPNGDVELAQKLVAPDVREGPRLGNAVALQDGLLVVSAPNATRTHESQGVVYTYALESGQWVRKQELAATQPARRASYGTFIAVDGDLMMIGAPTEVTTVGIGAAYALRRGPEGDWRPLARLVSPYPYTLDFSFPMALAGTQAAVAAPTTQLDGQQRGVVELYDLSCVLCAPDLDADGQLTIFDFLTFQNLFDAGDPLADFDGDGELTIFDFLAFQNAFDAGCP